MEFQLETGTDGNDWSALKVLPAAGYSNVINVYNYTHRDALLGSHYYRIKQTDLDGSFTYSVYICLTSTPIAMKKLICIAISTLY